MKRIKKKMLNNYQGKKVKIIFLDKNGKSN